MRAFITFGAAALALALALPAAAEPSPSASTAAPSPGASAAAPASSASAEVAAGLSVKDKTGATIGTVKEVKADATGKKLATIQMGADTFAVDASSLAVDNGAAVINASEAEIKNMMKK